MTTRGDPTQHQQDYWPSYIGQTVIVNVGGAPIANPTVLAPGHYVIYCRETALYVRQGGADVAVTANDWLLDRGTYRDLTVDDIDNGFIEVLTASGLAGTFRITRTSAPAGVAAPGTPTQHMNDFWSSYIGPSSVLSVPTSGSLRSAALAPGRYIVYCQEAALYLFQGTSAVVADDNQFLLDANTYRDLTVDDGTNNFLAMSSVDGIVGSCRLTLASAEA